LNRAIDVFSDNRLLRERLRPHFDRVADYTGSRLDYNGALEFFQKAGAELLGIKMGARELSEDEFMRFDFNGDSSLNFEEAVKCFRHNMLEIQKHIGGNARVPVPDKTPEQAGYEVLQTLASGGQGITALARAAEGLVALKIYDKGNCNAGGIEELRAELETMQNLEACPNIMHCIEIFQDSEHFYCVNELMPGGDLSCLRQNAALSGVALTESYCRGIFKQAVTALDYMHRHAMMHCDIKEPNIMIKSKDYLHPEIALIDFGLAQCSAGTGISGGTPGYMPPETLQNGVWFPRGDIFSMGVVFFQILADMTPSEKTGRGGLFTEGAKSIDDVIEATMHRKPSYNLISRQYPGVRLWLQAMLEKKLKDRPKAPTLLQDPWFYKQVFKN
jgi:serine/threonine protein kinase